MYSCNISVILTRKLPCWITQRFPVSMQIAISNSLLFAMSIRNGASRNPNMSRGSGKGQMASGAHGAVPEHCVEVRMDTIDLLQRKLSKKRGAVHEEI